MIKLTTRASFALNFCTQHFYKIFALTVISVLPLFTQAGLGSATRQLQLIAQSKAVELGTVMADDHWSRIEFSTIYDDPVVVIEPFPSGDGNFIAGIRNVDTKGFEINLKSCATGDTAPLQETVNFSVVENKGLTRDNGKKMSIRQRFAWGSCSTPAPASG